MRLDTHLRLPLNHPDGEKIAERLTRSNPEYTQALRLGFSTHGKPRVIREYTTTDTHWIFPRYWAKAVSNREQIEDRTAPGVSEDMGRPMVPRDYQVDPIDRAVSVLREDYGVTLKGAPGLGKSNVGIAIAQRLGVRTLILVHTEFLLDQWVDRIRDFTGVEAGRVQQDVYDVDKPFVVAMVQTLHSREYPQEFYTMFGLVIGDEIHRYSAETFVSTIQKFPARYRLGLTATEKRKDGLEWIFFSHIGPVGVEMSRDMLKPTVYRVNTNTESRDPNALRHRGKPSFTKAVSFIVEDEGRTALIAALAVDAVENGRGKIIVFSQRRKHLEVLQEYYVAQCEARGLNDASEDWAFYVGGMTTEQREAAEKHRVLFATVSLAAEGLDIPELDTVILSTPVADTIQIVGRAQRTMEGKLKPIVIDIVDRYVPELMGSARKRLRQYQEQGWEVRDVRD